jgi:hypothetical protein
MTSPIGLLIFKLFLCLLNEPPRHEHVRCSGSITPPFLASALHGCEIIASRQGRLTPGERALGSHFIGPITGLDRVEKKTIHRNGNRTLKFQAVVPRYADWIISYPYYRPIVVIIIIFIFRDDITKVQITYNSNACMLDMSVYFQLNKQNKLRDRSPRANYTDRATAAWRQS